MLFVTGTVCFAAGMQYGRANGAEVTPTELLNIARPGSFRQPLAAQRPWQHPMQFRSPLHPRFSWQPEVAQVSAFKPLIVHSTDSEKEEESQGHKPPSGHQARGMPELSPEDMALVNKFKEHQQNAARLTNPEEVRTLIEYSNGFGTLSTNSMQYPGFPTGSVVGFSLDDEGYPFMVFSSMSAHTGDIQKDGRVSLTVLAKDFQGAAEGRCVLIGEIGKLADDKKEAYKEMYMKRHPGAFWITFGDFTYYRMTSIKAVRYIGGFARAGSITGEEYLAAKPDPVAAYASHVMKHMNDDHGDATKAIVEHYVGVPIAEPSIVNLDSLGMTVKAILQIGPGGGGANKIRVPWDGGRITDRKEIKNVIVKMTKASAPQPTAEPAAAPSAAA